jgi:hypothetical protein
MGATTVGPVKVGRWGSHQRWPAVVGQRKWPGVVAFHGGGGAPLAEVGINESCSWRRGRGR